MSGITLSAEERKGLKGMVVEADRCLLEIDFQRDALKDIGESAEETFGVKKKVFNKMVRAYHKHDFTDIQSEHDTLEYLYEAVINGSTDGPPSDQEGEQD